MYNDDVHKLPWADEIRVLKMNDFAKKELLEIYGLLKYHYYDPELCINPNPELLLKLQSMIDNYCEHDCEHKWDGILISESPNTGKCEKCGGICYLALRGSVT